jgi:hypothetical protein
MRPERSSQVPALRAAAVVSGGWVLQLDGDAHRNAFLNTPWIKAVIPIRPGREAAAIKWLRAAHVEGEEGLDQDVEVEGTVMKLDAALLKLANDMRLDERAAEEARAGDRVFENGFDPLEGGTAVRPFPVFDAWVEVLPTDQVVAVEVSYSNDG